MPTYQAHYQAHTNIALIKYWGKRHSDLILPVTPSLSLTLEAFYTQTQVEFKPDDRQDSFILNGQVQDPKATAKVSQFVDHFRRQAQVPYRVQVTSQNYVPTAAGLASSASAYAALACACNAALDLNLSRRDLSIIARQGSGSATRSLYGGFVEWVAGQGDQSETSYGQPFADADWDLAMVVIIVNQAAKKFSSRWAMDHTMKTSPFYSQWAKQVDQDLAHIKPAILNHDLQTIGEIAEHNAMSMHALALSANPSLCYFQGESLTAMDQVRRLRQAGFLAYYTMDAGPNVKVLCPYSQAEAIRQRLSQVFPLDQLIISRPGPGPFSLEVNPA